VVPAVFGYGDLVQATAYLNVRSSPSLSTNIITTVPPGSHGTVVSGPQSGSGYTWFDINWDSGPSGWSAQDYLTRITTAAQVTGPGLAQHQRPVQHDDEP